VQNTYRYLRQVSLESIGSQGQLLLSKASVLVVGAGGLGCPIVTSLAAAGVGKICIMDADHIEEQNLSRQWAFEEAQVGSNKAQSLADFARKRNSTIAIQAIPEFLRPENAVKFISDFDVIVDATDNFNSRYIINDACVELSKPLVFGAVYKDLGQVSVFNYKDGPNLRDIFPFPPSEELTPNCEIEGVLGTSTSIIGNIQAREVINIILGNPRLTGVLLQLDLLSFEIQLTKVLPHPKSPLRDMQIDRRELNNNLDFCLSTNSSSQTMVNECSVKELHEMMEKGEAFWLIDVREQNEFDICNIGGELIPMSIIGERWSDIPSQGKVVIHCRSGVRSANIIRFLQEEHGYNNLLNLKGGILAWIDEVDTTLQRY
jgi:adenylyltransferase/sulfurtransferase